MIPMGVIQRNSRVPVNVDISIDGTHTNLNLLNLFIGIYGFPVAGDVVKFTIETTAIIRGGDQESDGGAPNGAPLPALRTGVWPGFVVPYVENNSSKVRGRGGNATGPNPGKIGGGCFLVESPIDCNNVNTFGSFSGGGGGGAGTDQWFNSGGPPQSYQAGGGGGAGDAIGKGKVVTGNNVNLSGTDALPNNIPGIGGNPGSDPTQPSFPVVIGGNGGVLGSPGGNASDVAFPGSEDNVGGLPGYSVSGFNLVNWINTGNLNGPVIL